MEDMSYLQRLVKGLDGAKRKAVHRGGVPSILTPSVEGEELVKVDKQKREDRAASNLLARAPGVLKRPTLGAMRRSAPENIDSAQRRWFRTMGLASAPFAAFGPSSPRVNALLIPHGPPT